MSLPSSRLNILEVEVTWRVEDPEDEDGMKG
jgi:hypothetical protein